MNIIITAEFTTEEKEAINIIANMDCGEIPCSRCVLASADGGICFKHFAKNVKRIIESIESEEE